MRRRKGLERAERSAASDGDDEELVGSDVQGRPLQVEGEEGELEGEGSSQAEKRSPCREQRRG